MMYLRFNEGAIVKFTLIGSANPVTVVGKVVEVLPDEVEICPQLRVYRKGAHSYGSHCTLDYTSTADSAATVHISRQLIQCWSYARVSDFDVSSNSISEDKSFSLKEAKPFSSYTFNYFDSDGFHRGDGPYCGSVKADPPSIILNIPNATDDNGMTMELSM